MQIKNWNEFTTVHKSGYLLCFTNGSHEFSVEFCVVKFSSFGWSFDGLWNKEWQEPKIGDVPDGIPSFVFNPSVNYLRLYFYSPHDMCFAWSVLYYMSLCFLVCHNHACCTHLFRGTHINCEFIRILYVLHLYLLS